MKLRIISIIFTILHFTHELKCQLNYIPNGDFENITGQVTISGLLELSTPWKIETQTPDLFNINAIWAFLRPPLITACDTIIPSSGNTFAGLSGYSKFEKESFSSSFNTSLKSGVTYYVAMNVRADMFCPGTNGGCITDGIGLSFVNNRLENRLVLDLNDPVLPAGKWITLEECYTSKGDELKILIKHFRDNDKTKLLCSGTVSEIFSYFYIDDVIVAPFDIVPDILYICKDSSVVIDTSFFGKDLFWNDNVIGGRRIITEQGQYVVNTKIGECILSDTLQVIEIEIDPKEKKIGLCNTTVNLDTDLPYNTTWNTGEEGNLITVSSPGIYIAKIDGPCGILERKFDVNDKYCEVKIFVPNIFNPFKSTLKLYINSDIPLVGSFKIFDRWGNLIFTKECSESCEWDGTWNGTKLNPQVFVWQFIYSINSAQRIKNGDITLIH